jgi:hypothetical protein
VGVAQRLLLKSLCLRVEGPFPGLSS